MNYPPIHPEALAGKAVYPQRVIDKIAQVLFFVLALGAFGVSLCGILLIVIVVFEDSLIFKKRSSEIQNIRQLGIALMVTASASENQRYPATSDGKQVAKTSTEVFAYLLKEKELPTSDLCFSPGADKVKFNGEGKLTARNVGYNYMKSKIGDSNGGVSMAADANLPLLWNSGNAPLVVKSNGSLTLLDTGIYKKRGCTVYYKGNNARWVKGNDSGVAEKFISPTFVESPVVVFSELAP